MNYYLSRDNKSHGPYTTEQLSAAAKAGKLKSADLLSGTAKGPWTKAYLVPEINIYFQTDDLSDFSKPANPYAPKKFTPPPTPKQTLNLNLWLISTIAGAWLATIIFTLIISYFMFSSKETNNAVAQKPQQQQPKIEQPQLEQPKIEQPQPEQPKIEQPQPVEQPQPEQPKIEQPIPTQQNAEPFIIKGIQFGLQMTELKKIVNSNDGFFFYRDQETKQVTSSLFLKDFTIGGIAKAEGSEYGWIATGRSTKKELDDKELELQNKITENKKKLDNKWTNGLRDNKELLDSITKDTRVLETEQSKLRQEINNHSTLCRLEWSGSSEVIDNGVNVFTKAYGEPSIQKFKSTTKAGVELNDYIATWEVKGVQIMMQRHINRDNGKITIMPLAEIKNLLESSKQRESKAVNDF